MVANPIREAALKLRAGENDSLYGEATLAVAKGLLQAGVHCISGHQSGPASRLVNTLDEAPDILSSLGIYFESTDHKAVPAAMLAASAGYPFRSVAILQSICGTHAAADMLSQLASGGITGGVLAIIGEDYGEGSSQVQERSESLALKSQIWMLDPRPDLSHLMTMAEQGLALSEESGTPVLYKLRQRNCRVTGEFRTNNNASSQFSALHPISARRATEKMVLPAQVESQERDKVSRKKLAAAFIKEQRLNEVIPGKHQHLGLIMSGGLYNTVIQALRHQALADIFTGSDIPLYILNVVHPLIPEEIIGFCENKMRVLVLEEGQPAYIESEIRALLQQQGLSLQLHGKDLLPVSGEYSTDVVLGGLTNFLKRAELTHQSTLQPPVPVLDATDQATLDNQVPDRPAGLRRDCPEWSLFNVLKRLTEEMADLHISLERSHHALAALEPFGLGNIVATPELVLTANAGLYGLLSRPPISVMSGVSFWQGGLNQSLIPSVDHQHEGILVITDRNTATNKQSTAVSGKKMSIKDACEGAGVRWVKKVSSQDSDAIENLLREALAIDRNGLKVLIIESILIEQTPIHTPLKVRLDDEQQTRIRKYYADPETCTTDHVRLWLSGHPAPALKTNPDPLKTNPVIYVNNDYVDCNLYGNAAQPALMTPCFSEVDLIYHPSRFNKGIARFRQAIANFFWRRAKARQRIL